MTKLNREKAVRIMSLMDELRAELVGTCISVEGSTTAAEVEEVKEQPIFRIKGEIPTERPLFRLEGKILNEQPKFKVGDIVVANDLSDYRYHITNKQNGYKGKVVSANSSRLVIETVKGMYSSPGEQYHIFEPKYFDLFVEQPKSPNQQRKEVIEKAKEFVENLLSKSKYGYGVVDHSTTPTTEITGTIKVEFIVNEKKRTIVALTSYYWMEGTTTKHKGIAKCNPSDVFNEHIGKAIALGRALGLDVSEFESAVQPTEKVVGHVVEFDGYQVELKPSDTSIICEYTKGSATINSCVASAGILQNDTKAIY